MQELNNNNLFDDIKDNNSNPYRINETNLTNHDMFLIRNIIKDEFKIYKGQLNET